MEIPEAVLFVFKATFLMKGGEIFVLKMKERSIAEFAKDAITKYGNGKKIKVSFIGMRPGEKLREALVTAEEINHTLETPSMFIILPLAFSSMTEALGPYQYQGAKKASGGTYVAR